MSAVELVVRTSKPEYESGEIIYGCVYLKIAATFPVHGIELRFYGYEKYHNCGKAADKLNKSWKEVELTSQLLYDEYLILYESKEPLSLGEYAFPFHKKLVLDLPAGGLLIQSDETSALKWRAEIKYGLQARTLGANSVEAQQSFSILQKLLQDLTPNSSVSTGNCLQVREGTRKSQSIFVSTGFPFFKSKVTTTAALDKNAYRTGENMNLSISFECDSRSVPEVSSLKFQLCRYLRISCNKTQQNRSLTFTDFAFRLWDLVSSPFSDSDVFSQENNSKEYILPEGLSTVIWKLSLCAMNGDRLNCGIQDMIIPLKTENGKDIPATTLGNHVAVIYSLNIEINFTRGSEPLIINVPVTCVQPSVTEWRRWQPLGWMSNCQLKSMKDSPYFVPQHIIESPEFSTLPPFNLI